MLDDLGGEHTTNRIIGKRCEAGNGVVHLHVESLVPAKEDHLEVEVNALGPDTLLSQKLEELTPSATDVDHVRRALEVLDMMRWWSVTSFSLPLNRSSKHV